MSINIYRHALRALGDELLRDVMSAGSQAELVLRLLASGRVAEAELVAGVPVIRLPARPPAPLPAPSPRLPGERRLLRLSPCPWRPGTEWARQSSLWSPGVTLGGWLARGGTRRVLREAERVSHMRISSA
jgi:hypothetical protein